jgi:hypothetical protein
MPWLTQEYERICDECGYVWRVPKAIAHPHMQGLPISGGRGIPGGQGVAAQTDAVVAANAELAERAAAYRCCPECESDHYKQRSIRS